MYPTCPYCKKNHDPRKGCTGYMNRQNREAVEGCKTHPEQAEGSSFEELWKKRPFYLEQPMDKTLATYWFELGQSLHRQAEGSSLGDIEEVIQLIRAIRDLHPEGVPMRDKLGNAIRCLNQFKKANPTTGEGEGR